MVQVFQSATYYRQKVEEQIHHLELLLNELLNEIPPSGPFKFAEANIKLIEIVKKFFLKEIQQSTVDEDIISRCKKYLDFLQKFTKNVVPFLESINEAFIPSELLFSLTHQTKQLAKKLNFSDNFDLRLCPRWDFNYGIYAYKNYIQTSLDMFPVDLFPELLKGLPSFPELFIFINYPRTESRNILLHSIIMHELGHLVDFQTCISDTICLKINIDETSFLKLYNKEKESEKSKQKDMQATDDELIQSLFDKCLEITKKWLSEFVCDSIATHLLGPPYFFALFELSTLTDNMYRYSECHPSSGIRLRFISDELYEMYLKNNNKLSNEKESELILNLYEYLKQKEKANAFKPTSSGNDYFQVVYETILPYRTLLQKTVRQKINTLSYDVNKFNNEVDDLFKDIKSGVPPSEFRSQHTNKNSSASFASILNCGWLACLFGMDDFYSVVSATKDADKLKALDNFNELLFKSIESSYILQEWLKK